MASVKKGILTPPSQWWKHLRETKRLFWKAERKAVRLDALKRLNETECRPQAT
jgi:hypothetical protein